MNYNVYDRKKMKMIQEAFKQFNDFNIMIIGDVMIDSYIWGKVNRISPEAPIPVVNATKRENRLGGAANVALNIQALGANPILCSVIGKDDKGKDFIDLLTNKRKISTEGIILSDKRITTAKHRIISAGQHLLRVDEETDFPLSEDLTRQLFKKIESIIIKRAIDAVIFQDYDKGVITPELIQKVTLICNKNNIPTLVDPKKRNFNEYKNVSFFKPNFKELTEGLNIQIEKKDTRELFKACKILKDKLNAKYIFTTLSEHGVFLTDGITYEHVPAELREIIDVSGAGDTVISTVSVCLAAKLPPKEIARISNKAGGLVCEKVGVVPIDKDKLLIEITKGS